MTVNVWNGSSSAAVGALIGGIVGGGLAAILGPRITRKRRERDMTKINESLAD